MRVNISNIQVFNHQAEENLSCISNIFAVNMFCAAIDFLIEVKVIFDLNLLFQSFAWHNTVSKKSQNVENPINTDFVFMKSFILVMLSNIDRLT